MGVESPSPASDEDNQSGRIVESPRLGDGLERIASLQSSLRLSALSGSLRLATSPVPGEVEFLHHVRAPTGSATAGPAQLHAGQPMPALDPSPGTGEGLRSQAQGEGAAAADSRQSPDWRENRSRIVESANCHGVIPRLGHDEAADAAMSAEPRDPARAPRGLGAAASRIAALASVQPMTLPMLPCGFRGGFGASAVRSIGPAKPVVDTSTVRPGLRMTPVGSRFLNRSQPGAASSMGRRIPWRRAVSTAMS
jgi:hypothetical protein